MWHVLNSKSTSWNPVERLLFPAPAASYDVSSFPDELIFIPRADGLQVPCLLLPFRHARFIIIYFHANAEDLGVCYSFCKILRDLLQVHMLVVEYPGYGLCPGKTDEDGIMANAMAAMRFARDTLQWPCDGIKLFGRSLGTGPTIALAAQYEVAGVILVSPFTSIQDLFRSQVGFLADFVDDRFRNHGLATQIESPTLIIHGQQDMLIPVAHGKLLYDALVARKMLVCPAAMGHNTSLLKSIGTFILPMTQFFCLPDYTFEDLPVPAWAYPANINALPSFEVPAEVPPTEKKTPAVPAIKGFSSLKASTAVPPAEEMQVRSFSQPDNSSFEEEQEEEERVDVQRPRLSPRVAPTAAGCRRTAGPGARAAAVSQGYDFKRPQSARAYSGPNAAATALEETRWAWTAREHPRDERAAPSGTPGSPALQKPLLKDLMDAIDGRLNGMAQGRGLQVGPKREAIPGRSTNTAAVRLTNIMSVESESTENYSL